jgi:hypothetical protein
MSPIPKLASPQPLFLTAAPSMHDLSTVELIRENIRSIRGHEVMLQADLARVYRVSVSRLLTVAQAFPGEFCFLLDDSEIPSPAEVGGRPRVVVFTEYGALAVAYALETPEALEIGLQVVRAFMRRRDAGINYEPAALSYARA